VRGERGCEECVCDVLGGFCFANFHRNVWKSIRLERGEESTEVISSTRSLQWTHVSPQQL